MDKNNIFGEKKKLTQRLFQVLANPQLLLMLVLTNTNFLDIFLLVLHSHQDGMDTPNLPERNILLILNIIVHQSHL